MLFTSGTTSEPKGVIHSLNSLRCGTANMVKALHVHGDDAFFLSSPLASITGILRVESALATHAKVILENTFSPERALDRVQAEEATVIGGAPFVAQSIFDEAKRLVRTLPLRCIAVGGSMVPQSVLDDAKSLNIEAVRIYGSSEAPFSTATDPTRNGVLNDDGAPLYGVEVAVRGADDELLIRGPHQFLGYLDAAHNRDAFADGWVRTGDQADLEYGRIRIKGRLKEVVVRKGMKISLAEIDTAATCLGDCAAFAVQDDVTGERLALAIRSTADDDISYEAMVQHLTSAGLAKWKLPEQVVLWDGPFPRTPSGKINRSQLADISRYRRCTYVPRLIH